MSRDLYYLYRHLRVNPSTSCEEVFYVGLGTVNQTAPKMRSRFARGYSKHGRNFIWQGIVSRSEMEVEIVMMSPDRKFIESKEKEFIALYGQIILGTGTLANIKPGGEGSLKDAESSRVRKVFVYSSDGKFLKRFKYIKDCSLEMGIPHNAISEALNKAGGRVSAGGFFFFSEFQGDNIGRIRIEKEINMKEVLAFDLNMNLIGEFFTNRDAAKVLNIPQAKIRVGCANQVIVENKYFFINKSEFNESKMEKYKEIIESKKRAYAVLKLDRDMNVLAKFSNSAEIAEILHCSGARIKSYCQSLKFDKENECYWRYANSKNIKPSLRSSRVPIKVFYKNGSSKEFKTLRETEKETGVSRKSIVKSCEGGVLTSTDLLFRFKK